MRICGSKHCMGSMVNIGEEGVVVNSMESRKLLRYQLLSDSGSTILTFQLTQVRGVPLPQLYVFPPIRRFFGLRERFRNSIG
jgi:hypothetical protein